MHDYLVFLFDTCINFIQELIQMIQMSSKYTSQHNMYMLLLKQKKKKILVENSVWLCIMVEFPLL